VAGVSLLRRQQWWFLLKFIYVHLRNAARPQETGRQSAPLRNFRPTTALLKAGKAVLGKAGFGGEGDFRFVREESPDT
jgi:hypothetical protein